MQLLLPPEIVRRLVAALKKAGPREIGGILMGEHVRENVFRVKDLTVQYHGGTLVTFWRVVQDITSPLRKFFRTTNYDFQRFNYLGEWHSHPSYALEPSAVDRQTMHDMIADPKLGAHFIVLMIVKLDGTRQFQGSVTVYQPESQECRGELIEERAET
jgi:proteasome lid subunit RPN8/RPN11